MTRASAQSNRFVFINCPFDSAFLEIFRAIVFAVIACGYRPRTAQDQNSSHTVRLDKIYDLIEECDWNIHDLSAVELDAGTGMPRFNMPLELGISLGAIRYGDAAQKRKRILVTERELHRYDVSISDISGVDISSHKGEPAAAIAAVRNWLAGHTPGLPGASALNDDYVQVRAEIEELIRTNRLDPWSDLPQSDYVICVEESLRKLSAGSGKP